MTSNDPRRKPPAPAQTPNGDHAFRPDAAKLIGKAVADAIGEALPQLLFNAFIQALSSVQVTTKPLKCVTCTLARLGWFAANADAIEAAEAARLAAIEAFPSGDPRRDTLNPIVFLPAHLQPSPDPAHPNPQAIPDLSDGTVMAAGTLYCMAHVPGAPEQASKRPFLIAQGNLSPGMIADIMQGRAA